MNKIKKKILICIISVLFALGIGAYVAADYFLFEHVEADLNSTNKIVEQTETEIKTEIEQTTTTIAPEPEIIITEMSYKSAEKSIEISKIVTGSGKDLLTYYVADVQINDVEILNTAFAKNKFGKNIIEYVSVIAERNDAIFAINGDYYGFRTDGIIIRNGVLYRDKPARNGLAIYSDGRAKIYDEREISAEQLLEDGVWQTLSFGPALLENGEILGGIDKAEVDKNIGNGSIQGRQPRTGIGVISENHFVFIVADGRQDNYSKGVKMPKFAQIFKDLGCVTAYNLDGGGSAEMWFMGKIINRPCNKNNSERGTSDIIFVK